MVKRFLIDYNGRGEYEHPSGDFVHLSDYQSLAYEYGVMCEQAGSWQRKAETAETKVTKLESDIQKVWEATGAKDVVFDEQGTELSEPWEVVEYLKQLLSKERKVIAEANEKISLQEIALNDLCISLNEERQILSELRDKIKEGTK